MQNTNTILMIRPVAFTYNEQTAINNYYQKKLTSEETIESVQEKALAEFDTTVQKLENAGVAVIVIEDTLIPHTPDSIFPNNWISFHENAMVTIYPMYAKNRRAERREDILDAVENEGFVIDEIVDFTEAETDNIFLEGTGSMVLDRINQKAYLALSPRSNEDLFIEFCEEFEYTPIIFSAYQTINNQRELIYHTNVMMCIADNYAIVCLASIDDKKERKIVVDSLREDQKEIITINENQVNHFAGNMLQVLSDNGPLLVMSTQAFQSLTPEQINLIEKYNPILHSDIQTIEKYGGGSMRCMMAEIFLPKSSF